MRPVPLKYPTSQGFGSGATHGVDPYSNHAMAYLVRQYGNYQPYGHAGEDIACPVGTPVQAMADGAVLWADWGTNLPGDESEWGYRQRWYLYKGFPGIVTVIQHPGWIGIYAHLSSNDAAPRGSKVKAGQLIGYSGDTGGVAPHLHREALVDLNYTTGGGLIYGRTDPTKYDGIAAAGIVPQSTTPKEDTLSAAEVKQIKDHITAETNRLIDYTGKVLVSGYSVGGQKFPGIAAVDINNQKTVRSILALVKELAGGKDLTPEQIEAAVAKALQENTVQVSINGKIEAL